MNGGKGNDIIYNENADATIYGGADHDSIYTQDGENVFIDGGEGNDSIHSQTSNKSTIYGGSGNDSIEIRALENYIDGGTGNDTIRNLIGRMTDSFGNTIYGGEGNDSIINENVFAQIYAGDGNDAIHNNYGNDVTIDAGEGDNYITNTWGDDTKNVSIVAGSGNDSVDSWGANVTINVGDGSNTVHNYNSDSPAVITTGKGDDTIHTSGVSTVLTGADNDTLYGGYIGTDTNLLSMLTVIDVGDGDDNVDYVGENPTSILASSGNNSIGTWLGTKTTVKTGGGDDVIQNGNAYSYIETGDGDDFIENNPTNEERGQGGDYSTIKAGKGNDTIDNMAANVWIEAGEGNDVVSLHSSDAKNSTIDAGTGNDSIYSFYWSGESNSINSGTGDDYIELVHGGNYNTVTSGAGKDTISIDTEEKNLTITDFDVNDVLATNNIMPTFAKFKNNVLSIDNTIKINLPNVTDINSYRNMIVAYDYPTQTITLGELLDNPVPYWTISGTTATYTSGDGKILATLTGLKSGLKVVDDEIDGIKINSYGTIELSAKVLGTNAVSLQSDNYSLSLADDVTHVSTHLTAGKLTALQAHIRQQSLKAVIKFLTKAKKLITSQKMKLETWRK